MRCSGGSSEEWAGEWASASAARWAGLLGSVALGVTLPFVIVAGSYALARAIFAAQVRRREAAAHALVDRLAGQVVEVLRASAPRLESAESGVDSAAREDG